MYLFNAIFKEKVVYLRGKFDHWTRKNWFNLKENDGDCCVTKEKGAVYDQISIGIQWEEGEIDQILERTFLWTLNKSKQNT